MPADKAKPRQLALAGFVAFEVVRDRMFLVDLAATYSPKS